MTDWVAEYVPEITVLVSAHPANTYPTLDIAPTVGRVIAAPPKLNESDVRDALPVPAPATYVMVKTRGVHCATSVTLAVDILKVDPAAYTVEVSDHPANVYPFLVRPEPDATVNVSPLECFGSVGTLPTPSLAL